MYFNLGSILKRIGILAGVLVCLAVIIVSFLRHPRPAEHIAWKEEFKIMGTLSIPKGWEIQGKPGTPKAIFSIKKEGSDSFLNMKADDASASLVTFVKGLNLEKTPILKWRWRVKTLPAGADGRVGSKDDQAIGIYVGTGSMLSKKSISYRWDTDTPDGTQGESTYGAGTIKVKWFTLRDKKDAEGGKWFTEERNCAEDFKKAWGFYPDKIYVSVSCNSQYTGTKASADLDWIKFVGDAEK